MPAPPCVRACMEGRNRSAKDGTKGRRHPSPAIPSLANRIQLPHPGSGRMPCEISAPWSNELPRITPHLSILRNCLAVLEGPNYPPHPCRCLTHYEPSISHAPPAALILVIGMAPWTAPRARSYCHGVTEGAALMGGYRLEAPRVKFGARSASPGTQTPRIGRSISGVAAIPRDRGFNTTVSPATQNTS